MTFTNNLSVKFVCNSKERLFDTLEQIRSERAGLEGMGKSVNFAFQTERWMGGVAIVQHRGKKNSAYSLHLFLIYTYCLCLNKWERCLPLASRTAGQVGLVRRKYASPTPCYVHPFVSQSKSARHGDCRLFGGFDELAQ